VADGLGFRMKSFFVIPDKGCMFAHFGFKKFNNFRSFIGCIMIPIIGARVHP